MQDKAKIAAIVVADIHLSATAPVWRSTEEDWYKAMARPLTELRDLQHKYDCPVICAGDVFDRWNSPPELINFALDHLPKDFYAIPGQHDLPYHNYKEGGKSAYWTLVKAGRIIPLEDYTHGMRLPHSNIIIQGFVFNEEITPLRKPDTKHKYIAVSHAYIWMPGASYANAPEKKKVSRTGMERKKWRGWDAVIYGDNHIGFATKVDKTLIYNCGGFMRRKSDEEALRPRVGLLTTKGDILVHSLDCSQDQCISTIQQTKTKMSDKRLESFIKELESLDSVSLSFEDAMSIYFQKNKISKSVRGLVERAMNL